LVGVQTMQLSVSCYLVSSLNNTKSLASSLALSATSAALGVQAEAQVDANTAITNINDVNFMLVSPF